MEDILILFLNNIIPDMKGTELDLTYIKFVFSDEALEEMAKYNIESVDYLRKIKKEYETEIKNNEDVYIKVNDYKSFFFLLKEITMAFDNTQYGRLRDCYELLESIWLKMSPDDINNINLFLKKQLIFLRNANLIPYHYKFYKNYQDIPVYYRNRSNTEWFETANNILFSFERKNNKNNDILQNDYYYHLPSIHYALTKENGNGVCYIYGIQNIEKEKDEVLKERIQPLRRKLRNKYVSPDFIIALKLFIDLLADNHIYTIKVPLLQVFNYPYHKHLSRKIKKAYEGYENKEELERKLKEGSRENMVLFYEHTKKMYEKFVGKEDIISKNKTERLVEAFMVMSEKYDNIEFLTDSFIESDYLLINIKRTDKKTKQYLKS